MIWALLVGGCDTFLKPIMLGKGAPAPMLIIFIGSIGGFIMSGIIGLFVGAVIFSLGYQLFMAWLAMDDNIPAHQ
jgi:predicted PurR-regulated permease PerM